MESFKPTHPNEPALDATQTAAAVAELYNPRVFKAVNRKFIDPPKAGDPRFLLFSFTKAEGATPDKNGFLGVAKIRGAYTTAQEAEIGAEQIIREVDSANSVFTMLMGHPFPLVVRGFAENLSEVDLSKKTEQVIAENVRAKRRAEEKEIREINERKAALLNDDGSIKESAEPVLTYTDQRVKLAHLRWAIYEHTKKAIECRAMEQKVRAELRACDQENPMFNQEFLIKYIEGRRQANIPEETDFTGFMQFLTEPVDPEVEKHLSIHCETCQTV